MKKNRKKELIDALKYRKRHFVGMHPDPEWLILSWIIGLIGALLAISSIYYIHKSYNNMKGGKLGRAFKKICLATVFVIFGSLNLALTASQIIPQSAVVSMASGLLVLLAGLFFFRGYKELNYLTEPA